MNMDRKYKEAENRTSEYLELKYGTDVQSGLSLAEVRRRRHICGTYNIARRSKKRIWLIYLKKRMPESVFLFLSLSVWDKPDILFSKENTTFVILYFIFSHYYKYKDSISGVEKYFLNRRKRKQRK